MNRKILEDCDTDFIILAGIRYGIGRASYAPSLICDWIKNHWYELSDNLRSQIERDIKSEIEVWFNMREMPYGDSCNASVWKNLIAWMDDQSAEDGMMTAAGEKNMMDEETKKSISYLVNEINNNPDDIVDIVNETFCDEGLVAEWVDETPYEIKIRRI